MPHAGWKVHVGWGQDMKGLEWNRHGTNTTVQSSYGLDPTPPLTPSASSTGGTQEDLKR